MRCTMANKKKPRKAGMTPAAFRSLLESRGILQVDAAKKLGVHLNTVNNWVNGRAPITPAAAALIREKLA